MRAYSNPVGVYVDQGFCPCCGKRYGAYDAPTKTGANVMGYFILAAYLILIGIMGLVQTNVPHWVAAALALVAGLALLFVGFRDYRRP